MGILISGTTNDILVNGVSVATDTEVSSAITDAVTTAGIALKTIASGTATFTATTNNINLTGIGIGVEIGDVIQISGADDAKNNSEFTIEVITDANNIIVNQAHANKGTTKNVANRSGDTGVTVKLLSKWFNAPIGLGQDWVDVTASRAKNTNYTNNTKRQIGISVSFYGYTAVELAIFISAVRVSFTYVQGASINQVVNSSHTVPIGSIYSAATVDTVDNVSSWFELR